MAASFGAGDRLTIVVVYPDNRVTQINFFDIEERDQYINEQKQMAPAGTVICIEGSVVCGINATLAREWEVSDAFTDPGGLPVFAPKTTRRPACKVTPPHDEDILVIEFDRVADRAGLLHRDVLRYPALLRAARINPETITPAIVARAAAYDRAEVARMCAAAGASLKRY